MVVLVQPHDAVGSRLREDDTDVRQPEGVVRARQAFDHYLRHRAAPDDAGDVGSWLKLRGIRWRLREGCARPCRQHEGECKERLACHGKDFSTDRDDGYATNERTVRLRAHPPLSIAGLYASWNSVAPLKNVQQGVQGDRAPAHARRRARKSSKIYPASIPSFKSGREERGPQSSAFLDTQWQRRSLRIPHVPTGVQE